MILGIGTDLCDIRRIERALRRFSGRFVERLFTAEELSQSNLRAEQERASFYALRFAAKEACAKALGTGFRRGVFWRNISTGNHPSGQPFLTLTGGALDRLLFLTPPGAAPCVNISLSDEYPLAQATVIISAIPAKEEGRKP